MNIQEEVQKIHNQYGTSEMANYQIQLLFDREFKKLPVIGTKGVELIAKERQEQIEKHGFSIEKDKINNDGKQLVTAASHLLIDINDVEDDLQDRYIPCEWNSSKFYKMWNKPYRERLIIAGALIAAELDRINEE